MPQYSKEWWYPNGDSAIGVRALVFLEDQSTLASIFSDSGLTVPLANPTATDGLGILTFYADDGLYWIYVGDDFSGESELIGLGPVVSGAVISVNGQAGVVVLDSADVGAQPIATINAKGDLYAGTADNATTRLPVGANGFVLSANSATSTGLEWIVAPSAPVTSVNAQTGAVILTFSDVGAQQSDSDLTAIANLTPVNDDIIQRKSGVWTNRTIAQYKADLAYTAAQVGAQPIATIDAKGDLYVGTANDATTRLPVGANGQALVANSATTTGLEWQTPPTAPVTSVNTQTGAVVLDADDVGAAHATRNINSGIAMSGGGNLTADLTLDVDLGTTAGTAAAGDDTRIVGAQQRSTLTAKGDIYAATASATTTRLPVGTNGQTLVANSATSTGLEWQNPPTAPVTSVNGQTGVVVLTSTVVVADAVAT